MLLRPCSKRTRICAAAATPQRGLRPWLSRPTFSPAPACCQCSATASTTPSRSAATRPDAFSSTAAPSPSTGGTPTVANTSLIQVFGQGGNDTITLDEANGALPAAQSVRRRRQRHADRRLGQRSCCSARRGNDTLLGKGGNDLLFGGAGNDMLTGGDGDDQMFGEAGNDRMIWNPGDDTDLMEGGDGNDTAEVNGGNGAETFTITANGTRVRFDRVSPAPFSSTSAPPRTSSSTPMAATTSSPPATASPASSSSPSTAAPATTRSSAATATTR